MLQEKNKSVEFWRFVFTLLVVLGHIQASSDQLGPNRFTTGGYSVEFFFMLSGFFLCNSFIKKFDVSRPIVKQVLSFLFSRLKRFIPYCWLFIIASSSYHLYLYHLIGYTSNQMITYLKGLWAEVVMLNSIFVSSDPANGPTWYISALIIISVFYYLVLSCEKKLNVPIIAIPLLCSTYVLYQGYWCNNWYDYALLLRALGSIGLGITCYILVQKTSNYVCKFSCWFWQTIQLGSIIAFVLVFYRLPDSHTQILLLIPFFVFLYTLFSVRTPLNRILNNQISQALGKISFIIYLSHSLLITRMLWQPHFDLSGDIRIIYLKMILIIILISMVIAYLPQFFKEMFEDKSEEPPLVRSNREVWPDVLRVVAILSVIILHVSGGMLWAAAPGTDEFFWLASVDTLVHGAVPLFLMLSGMFLLSPKKEIDLQTVFRKYILRLLNAYIIWSAFYAVFNSIFNDTLFSAGIVGIGELFLKGRYHLWFLPMMIGSYLVLPLLRCVTEKKSKLLLNYTMILFFVFSVLYPSLSIYDYSTTAFLQNLNPSCFGIYVGYFFAGYYFSIIPLKPIDKYLWPIAAIFFGVICVHNVINSSLLNGALNENAWSGNQFPMTIYAISIFMVFRIYGNCITQKFQIPHISSKIHYLAKISFDIYLCHDIFITVFNSVGLHALTWHPIVSIPFVSVIVLVASLILTRLIKNKKDTI